MFNGLLAIGFALFNEYLLVTTSGWFCLLVDLFLVMDCVRFTIFWMDVVVVRVGIIVFVVFALVGIEVESLGSDNVVDAEDFVPTFVRPLTTTVFPS